jgi:hypothetical protein
MRTVVNQPEQSNTRQWREIAWNGVCFEVPTNWDIGEIGRQYLLLASDTGPQMEIKWGPVKGKFSPRAQLKRLAASQGRKMRKDLHEETLPAAWARSLSRYESIGFSWQGGVIGGHGAVLYCPHCRQATLLQFYQAPFDRPAPYADRLLASFEDHTEQPLTTWSVFDIRAEIPGDYRLKTFRFDAGLYELAFTSRKSLLTLQRWSPADALLGQDGLVGFERKYLAYSTNRSMTVKTSSRQTVEVEDISHKGILRRLRKHLRRQPQYIRARLWHEADKNRILGVRLEGRWPIDWQYLQSICTNYETI